MTIEVDSISEIDAGERLLIPQVSALYTQLLSALTQGQAVHLDVSRVERIDAAALQLFYLFQREAQQHNLVVLWTEPSQAFCDAAALLGMPTFYQSPQDRFYQELK